MMFDLDAGMPRLNRSLVYVGACLIAWYPAGTRAAGERPGGSQNAIEDQSLQGITGTGDVPIVPVVNNGQTASSWLDYSKSCSSTSLSAKIRTFVNDLLA
jgi:hypothetical protein